MSFDQDRQRYFNMLYGVKTFQLFHDKKKSLGVPKIFHCVGDLPLSWMIRLEDLNSDGMGVFMSVNETNGQGRKATDVKRIRACFADFDGVSIDPVWDDRPTMVVESSSGKFHAYWVTTDVPLDGFTQIQKAIAHKYGSDPKVCDLPRVLRVPGFYHSKGDRFLTKIIHKTDAEFSFRELQEMFPPAPVEQWTAPKYQKQSDFPQDGEFKGQLGACAGGRNAHVMARIGGAKKRGLSWNQIEIEAFREAGACSPPLSGSETRAILKSFRRYC